MRKFIIIAASFAALLALTATAAIAAPGVTTHTVTLNAATDGVVDLPALNSQFTTMTIKVNDGTANWGAADLGYWTSYTDGVVTTGVPMTSGIWGDASLPGHGPLLLEGTQVGAVIYRLDGGDWQRVHRHDDHHDGRRHPQRAGRLQRPPRLLRRQLRLPEPHGRPHQGVTKPWLAGPTTIAGPAHSGS